MVMPDSQPSTDETPERKPAEIDAQAAANEQAASALQFKPIDLPDFPALQPYAPQVESTKTDMATVRELAEELAEDMLRLMERMKRLDAKQEQLYEQMSSVQQTLQENRKQSAIEMNQLRQELLGERKALAVRSVFNAIAPMLDALRAMRRALEDTPENNTLQAQLNTVTSSLTNIIQSLGYVEFQVEVGASFDPFQMECLSYGAGEPNTVLEIVRPGYRTENMIVRPCGVVIAQVTTLKSSQA